MKKIFLFVLLTGVAASLGYGQTHQPFDVYWNSIIEQTVWQVGPFHLVPRIMFREIGYDANVYRERETDDPVQDYTATFSPEITAYLLLGHSMVLSFKENPEYVYYLKQERERRWNHNYSPELRWKLLNRFVLGGKYSYENRRYRFSSEVDFRVNTQTKRYEGSLFYETPRNSSLGVRYTSNRIAFQDMDLPGNEFLFFQQLSRNEDEVSGELYYQLLSDSYFFLRGGYTWYRFVNEEVSFRDTDSSQIYAGIQFPFLGRMLGTLSLGYKSFFPLAEEREAFSGLVGNTDLEYRAGRFRLRLGYTRDHRFSYWSEALYFIENQINTGFSFYLSQFLRLDYDFRYGENEYPETVYWGPELIQRTDVYRSHTGGLALRIIRDIGISLNLNYWERETNIFYGDRDWWFIGGSLVYDF